MPRRASSRPRCATSVRASSGPVRPRPRGAAGRRARRARPRRAGAAGSRRRRCPAAGSRVDEGRARGSPGVRSPGAWWSAWRQPTRPATGRGHRVGASVHAGLRTGGMWASRCRSRAATLSRCPVPRPSRARPVRPRRRRRRAGRRRLRGGLLDEQLRAGLPHRERRRAGHTRARLLGDAAARRPTATRSSAVGELVAGFPAALIPVPDGAEVLLSSAAPVDGTDLTEVSLNLRTAQDTAGLLAAVRAPARRGRLRRERPARRRARPRRAVHVLPRRRLRAARRRHPRPGRRAHAHARRAGPRSSAVGCPREPHDPALVDVEDVRSRIDELLTRHVARLRTVLAAASDDADVLADAVAQILTGGKRLRAAFCYWSWRAHGGQAGDRRGGRGAAGRAPRSSCSRPPRCSTTTSWTTPTPAAASPRRTGRSRACTPQHGLTGDAERFGMSAAILLGDLTLIASEQEFAGALALQPLAAGRARPRRVRPDAHRGHRRASTWTCWRRRCRGATTRPPTRHAPARSSARRPPATASSTRSSSAPRSPTPTRRARGVPRRSVCRSARRSSSATTCSGCSATRRRPASPPATTCARASARS